jgi:ectoine hydroxylase-related dioxygenase (phytanoyl-CoA dioxygenase family)
MKTDVSQEQTDYYRRNGFIVLDEFLTADELEELRAAVSMGVDQMGRTKVAGAGLDTVEEQGYRDTKFLQRINLWKINDTIRGYFLSPALGEMLCRLEGIDGVRIWHDQTLQKQPWANPTVWHSDVRHWSFYTKHAMTIWVALDDATLVNGCLYYLAGSHKVSRFDQVAIGDEVAGYFETFPEFRANEAIPAAMKAGQAAVHNGLIAHAAGPNMTPGWRRAMTCA